MEVRSHFNHFNFNVTDLERSKTFYREALGLEKVGEILHPDGAFIINYLSAPGETFRLELTWLRDHPQRYDLGEDEFHLAMTVQDYDKVKAYHRERGWICYENTEMDVYFIEDPDGYWIEILKS